MLKGQIFITDNMDVIFNTPLNQFSKVVSLDEDDVLEKSNNVLGGTCLLPPMEAKIAEADGNEQMYDAIYSEHLLMPFQQQFIAALIAFLYKGGNLIIFLPEIGYNNTANKFIEHLFRLYGIHPGLIGDSNPMIANCYYDTKCIPIWLNLLFIADVVSPTEFLYLYPEDAVINNESVMRKLLDYIRPYGETISEKRNYIHRYHKMIHKNPRCVPAIYEKGELIC